MWWGSCSNKYEGGWSQGYFHGEGIFYYADGTSEKAVHNLGVLKSKSPNIIRKNYDDGAWYEGEFKNGKYHGQGTFCWTNGTKYVGPFADGMCHGEGILYYNDGTSEKVTYNNGNVVNKSPNILRENYNDGSWYEGEIKDGLRNGKGTYYWANGDRYIGNWSKGAMHGTGVITYSDGRKEFVTCENGKYISRRKIGGR